MSYCFSFAVIAETYSAKQISEMCSPAVFYIEVKGDNFSASGSGFFINGNGVAVTNYHVIKDTYNAVITTTDNQQYTVNEILYYNKDRDIAVIKVSSTSLTGKAVTSFPFLNIQPSKEVSNGDNIFTIGSPKGMQNTISNGIVSNRYRTIEGSENYPYIQITAPISSGSSGGALINESGYAIGVTTATRLDAQNINLAVPLDSVITLDLNAEGIPYSSLNAGDKESTDNNVTYLFKKIVYEQNTGIYNNIENINPRETMIGTFSSYLNIDNYYFTINKETVVNIYAGGYPELGTIYEKSAFNTMLAGLYDAKDNLIEVCQKSYTSSGYPTLYCSVKLSPGNYKITTLNDSHSDSMWSGLKYFVYLETDVKDNAHHVGDVVNIAAYTDIVAYINNFPIQSFNINGNTAICAEDLAKYGFSVVWNADTRTLNLIRSKDMFVSSNFTPTVIKKEDIGKKVYDVLYTDIITYINGIRIDSFNINGSTIIYFDDLSKFGDVSWDDKSRSIRADIKGIIINDTILDYDNYKQVPDFSKAMSYCSFKSVELKNGYGYSNVNSDEIFNKNAFAVYDFYLQKCRIQYSKKI